MQVHFLGLCFGYFEEQLQVGIPTACNPFYSAQENLLLVKPLILCLDLRELWQLLDFTIEIQRITLCCCLRNSQ
jgi:hypothetical protein